MQHSPDGHDDRITRRVLRLEQRLHSLQEFIEDGIADPWDELEQRIAMFEGRIGAIDQRLTRLEGSAQGSSSSHTPRARDLG